MLSQAMSDRLNKQINLEMYSSHLYLQMSSWCAYQSLDGCEEFFAAARPRRSRTYASPGRLHARNGGLCRARRHGRTADAV